MMLAEPAARAGARRHFWRALLALSLALNLFFVGGALWIRIRAPAPIISPEHRLEQMASELGLDPGQKQGFALYSQAMREKFQSMHKAVRPLIGDAWSEVAKPHADETKVMRLLDQAGEERRVFLRDLTTTTLSFLATLSPEQRAKFVQLARQHPRPWSPPRDRDGPR